ncbi:hypothetical protein GALMADRAFT_88915 [Galerina marginata CBS 339.88]|uniref:Mitochondrial K+-H+ exchange-related-domain-containing protein n=1 Tax=Galerina marginata (strain CBS 339.88) TaxID=685588 RepID=A0A067TIP5_GALM3|nr:hypothetical protein GALMADRAFT_88915 [Galerina marginata CBS 339.88]
MAMLPALRKMRIIAIPLTRPNARLPQHTNAKLNRLTYYQFQISAKKPKKPPSSSTAQTKGKDKEAEEKKGWLPEEGVVNWATQKAADIWAGFGKAEGGWKLKTYQFGEKLVDRMEFEELALKSIDPSLGPSITQLKRTPVLDEKNNSTTIALIFPPSLLSPSTSLSDLRAYVEHRIPRHRKGFYLWMIIAPFTAPFMIIPIIPNLPFFFCAWRSWSHYRAYRSSQYLQSLLEHNLIVPQANEALDQVYRTYQISPHPIMSKPEHSTTGSAPSSEAKSKPADEGSSSSSSPNSSSTTNPDTSIHPHQTLLTRDAVPSILSIFELGPASTAAADLYRAVEQARVRVATGRSEL